MRLIKKTDAVYSTSSIIPTIKPEDMDFLYNKAKCEGVARIRINIHHQDDDLLHEMFIAIRSDSYIRPHKHLNKTESFHIVQGDVDVVIFEDDGTILDMIELSSNGKKAFYYRLPQSIFHTLMVKSNIVIIHEITNGPFVQNDAIWSDFAPTNSDLNAIVLWEESLAKRTQDWRIKQKNDLHH